MDLCSLWNKLRESAAIVFHNNPDSKRFFPFYIGIGWRDSKGFNPGILYCVTQTGQRDKHLLPLGYRIVTGQWHLFGQRWAD